MDHELIDGERVPHRTRSDDSEHAGDPAFDLPRQVGNRAFTAIAHSALQRDARHSQGAGPLDPEIASEIEAARGSGSALSDDVRTEMETSLGADLSGVRVHTDSQADGLSRSVQAEAFTTGSDVFFRRGTFDPTSSTGRGLLAHELTHVVQQRRGEVDGGRVSHPGDPHEVEAKGVGDVVAAASPGVSRQEDPDEEEEVLG